MIKTFYTIDNLTNYIIDYNGDKIVMFAKLRANDDLVDISFNSDSGNYLEVSILDIADHFNLIINQNDDESYGLSCGEDNYQITTEEELKGFNGISLNEIKGMSITDFITLLNKLNK